MIPDELLLMCLIAPLQTGFEINTNLWVWHAIKWVEFANPLTSVVSGLAQLSWDKPPLPVLLGKISALTCT